MFCTSSSPYPLSTFTVFGFLQHRRRPTLLGSSPTSAKMLLSIPISSLSAAKRPPFPPGKFAHSEPRVTPLPTRRSFPFSISTERRGLGFACFYNPNDKFETPPPTKWPVLKRWEVPWPWQTFVLTNLACALSFVLVGFAESSVLSYLGFQNGDLTLDSKAEVLFLNQFIATAAILGVIFGITNTFQPLPNDVLRYDLKGPFKLKDGWLLWAGIGLFGAIVAIVLAGSALTLVNGDNPTRETDALIRLLPLVGSSYVSTACLLGITGVLAPVLEETVFRGFLMVTLTKWLPTPVSVLLSAALFSAAHLTPGEFPQLFVLGTALGFSYAQTRNLLTPITIHALWNSSVIILLTFLQLQGYDLRELLQGS